MAGWNYVSAPRASSAPGARSAPAPATPRSARAARAPPGRPEISPRARRRSRSAGRRLARDGRARGVVGRGLAALEQRRGHAHDAGPRLLAVLVELAPPVVRRVEAAEARPRELLLGPVRALDGDDLCGNQDFTARSRRPPRHRRRTRHTG